MIGLTSIKRMLEVIYRSASKDEMKSISFAFSDLLNWSESDDYLFPFFHQNDRRQGALTIQHHGVAHWLLKSAICKGDIYMTYIPTPSMAMENKRLKDIEGWGINGISFKIYNSPQGSDGFLKLTRDLNIKELAVNDEEAIKKDLKVKQIKSGDSIPLEIGTNDICKTAWYLLNPTGMRTIARLPYDFGKGNRMAILFCVRPKNIDELFGY